MSYISNEVKSIISRLSVDNTQQPIFFGAPLGLQRYDNPKYQKLANYFNNQLVMYWRPEEITLTKDASDFKTLTAHEQKIFTHNLGFQILLDSVQSRGISHLLEYCSNSEVEIFCKVWEFFETIHSYSYTYIIKNIYPNPTIVLDELARNEAILSRMTGVTKYYDEMISTFENGTTEKDRKKALYLNLVSIQILEAVRFYVSFACSYYFAKCGKMIGNAEIIGLINRDENIHLGFTKDLINILKKNPDEGFIEIIEECEPIVQKMWADAGEEEMKWADFLFEDGDLVGLTANDLKNYMKYLVNQRMRLLGSKPIYEKTQNPIIWVEKFTNKKNKQNAPQENENTQYLTGALNVNTLGNLSDMDLGDL